MVDSVSLTDSSLGGGISRHTGLKVIETLLWIICCETESQSQQHRTKLNA